MCPGCNSLPAKTCIPLGRCIFFNKLPPSIRSLTFGQFEAAVPVTANRESSVLFVEKLVILNYFTQPSLLSIPNCFKIKKMVSLGLMVIIALTQPQLLNTFFSQQLKSKYTVLRLHQISPTYLEYFPKRALEANIFSCKTITLWTELISPVFINRRQIEMVH